MKNETGVTNRRPTDGEQEVIMRAMALRSQLNKSSLILVGWLMVNPSDEDERGTWSKLLGLDVIVRRDDPNYDQDTLLAISA